MIQPTIDKLSGYISYYIKQVIGLSVTLIDSPQPCSINKDDPVIELPMTPDTLGQFLGPEFVEQAPVELLFSIVIGLAYHEAAHLMSGEKHVEPHILDNIINDSNDFTYVPEQWKGSMPFTISLMNTTYQQGMDLKDIPLRSRAEKLQALIHLSVSYMRKLRIRENNKDSRSLPKKHTLESYFDRIKPIMREARKADIKKRPELVGQLYDVLKDFWDTDIGPTQQSFDEALKGSQLEVTIILDGADAQKLKKKLEALGTMQKVAGDLKRAVICVTAQEVAEEKKKDKRALKRIHELGDLGSNITQEEPDGNAEPVTVNHDIVRKLRRALKPLLFERSFARRKPSFIGTRFSPSHFHEIKTQPDKPRIRKAVKRIGRAEVETALILCFDRSGSMNGDKEHTCKEIAGTFSEALRGIPQTTTSIMGFDTNVRMIADGKTAQRNNMLRLIASGLAARGGTNFPLALYQTLRIAEKKNARKKIIIMLTDGDISGNIHLNDLVRYAGHHCVQVLVIGISGSDEENIRHWFGKDNTLYVENVSLLPALMAKTIQKVI